jgi:hypothetical protein
VHVFIQEHILRLDVAIYHSLHVTHNSLPAQAATDKQKFFGGRRISQSFAGSALLRAIGAARKALLCKSWMQEKND